jgi:hypothetical protein
MFKEFILAIVVGAILGLGITGIYLATQHKNNIPNNNNSIITEPTLIPTPINQNSSNDIEKKEFIDITSPENNSLVFTSKTTITGTTTPKSNIVIATSTNTFTGKSDQDGKFEISINLEGGLNIIKISAIDSENNQRDTSINITYSTAKI